MYGKIIIECIYSFRYNLEAYRAINQAIGRVIRHKNDFGAILFLDKRFGGSNVKSQLSDWIQPAFSVSDKFPSFLSEMKAFFGSTGELYSEAKKPKKVEPSHSLSSPTVKRPLLPSMNAPALNPPKRKRFINKSIESSSKPPSLPPTKEGAAQLLVLKLKKSLSKEEMNAFKGFVKDYKSSNDFEIMRKITKETWFKNKFDREDKLDFRAFIKEHHRESYTQEINLL
ncbi:Uncharacterized protein FKW44_004457 [Caligus rogercresseyi]|uniref:ATP-dependent helicase C-terminal domain-containing protein n=1 Tax=Caligus rogercresseyi TaxID=217165 RepID=A0A7T8HLL4_CALRO|nr:Uncharacterized protein FKW44_004457 [Caligus rogercresseyi]